MKDITAASFGLIIAYLLPGLVGLYSLTFYSVGLRKVLDTFLQSKSDAGLFLLALSAALVVGLQVNAIRFVLFERIFFRNTKISAEAFTKLTTEAKLKGFLAVVEENFRYHQFFGSMSIILPIIYVAWLTHHWSAVSTPMNWLAIISGIAFELVTVYAAYTGLSRYVSRATQILMAEEEDQHNVLTTTGEAQPLTTNDKVGYAEKKNFIPGLIGATIFWITVVRTADILLKPNADRVRQTLKRRM